MSYTYSRVFTNFTNYRIDHMSVTCFTWVLIINKNTCTLISIYNNVWRISKWKCNSLFILQWFCLVKCVCIYRECYVPVFVHFSILGKLERGIHGEALPKFYLSYSHYLQTVKVYLINKNSATIYSIARKSSPCRHWHSKLAIKIEYTVSDSQTIHWWNWTQ